MITSFVSSTFSDMNYERDIIQTRVTAIVNEKAREYGETVSFCDLRWGINTEDMGETEANKKVLDVCLDEIDRSAPPFIVLLGYRYGWIPGKYGDKALVAEAADRVYLDLEEPEISITELEIRFGALSRRGKRMPTLFYFREIDAEAELPKMYLCESDEHKRKLDVLKKCITDSFGSSVKTYHLRWNNQGFDDDDLRRFAHMVADDVVGMLQPRWSERKNLSALDKLLLPHFAFVQEKGSLLCVREQLVERFANAFARPEAVTFVVHGKPGVGKSTLASALALRLTNRGNRHTLFIECGLTVATSTWEGVYEVFAMYIERLLERRGVTEQQDNIDRQSPRKRLENVCRLAQVSGLRVALVLDAVDQLSDSDSFETLEAALAITTSAVSVFVTSLSDMWPRTDKSIVLAELSDDIEMLEVIEVIENNRSHRISNGAKQALLRKTEARNPLYLSLVVQRLLLMHRPDFERIHHEGGTMEAVARQELRVVHSCPHTLNEMALELLLEAGRRINEAAVMQAIHCIAMSRFGMRPTDLEALCPGVWSPLDFAHLMHYLRESFLVRDDGRIDFAHRCVREAVLRSQSWRMWCDKQSVIARYLWELHEGDPVRRKELAYHCLEGSEDQRLVALIKESMINADQEQLKEIAQVFVARCKYEVRNDLCGRSQDRIYSFTSRFGSAVERYRGTGSVRSPLAVEEALRWTKDPQPNDVLLVSFFCNEAHLSFGTSQLDTAAFCHLIFNVRRMAVEIVDECKTYPACIHAFDAENAAAHAVYMGVLTGLIENNVVDSTIREIADFIRYSISVECNLHSDVTIDEDEKTATYMALAASKCLLSMWMSRLLSLRKKEGDYDIAFGILKSVIEECEPFIKTMPDTAAKSSDCIVKALMEAYIEQARLITVFSDTDRLAYGVECLKRVGILHDYLSKNSTERDLVHESLHMDALFAIVMSANLQIASYYESDSRVKSEEVLNSIYSTVEYMISEFGYLVTTKGNWRARTGLAACYRLRASILYTQLFQEPDCHIAERAISDQRRALEITSDLYSESRIAAHAVQLMVDLVILAICYLFSESDEAIEYSKRYFDESKMIGVDNADFSDEDTKAFYSQYLLLCARYEEMVRIRRYERRKTMEDLANTLVLTGEDGNYVEYELLDRIEFGEVEYVILLPNDEPEDGGDVVILKVEDTNDPELESYESVDNFATYVKVLDIFKTRFADEFNFTD